MTTRRDFLISSAALLAAGCTGAGPKVATAPRTALLPLGFSTLGCPRLEWNQILDLAVANGYAALELRGIMGELDLTRRPEFAPGRVSRTRAELADRGLRVMNLGSSANMHEPDAAKRAVQLTGAKRFIDLASALGTPYVRVFGNNYVAGETHEVTIARIAAGLAELGAYGAGHGVTVLIESHGDFVDSPTLRDLLGRVASPDVALLWDAHHTFASGNEQPEETVRQLGQWIRHTHLKDSVPAGNDRRYVLTGTGQVPVRRQIEALAGIGYTGYYSFEWEKTWHPEIEEPEVAIPQFARVAGEYLRTAGVTPREIPAR
jgi:sugar phosphate isomerase/epimerase